MYHNTPEPGVPKAFTEGLHGWKQEENDKTQRNRRVKGRGTRSKRQRIGTVTANRLTANLLNRFNRLRQSNQAKLFENGKRVSERQESSPDEMKKMIDAQNEKAAIKGLEDQKSADSSKENRC